MTIGNTSTYILALLMLSGLLSSIIFLHGLPIGHDYKNLIITYEEISSQLRQGEIYPRWLTNVNNGFGGANLFIYSPLAYYLTFMIDTLSLYSLGTTTLLSFSIFMLVFLSGLSFFLFARKVTTPKASIILSAIYMFLPYHSWFDIYERNALAELSSYIWIPLIFYCLTCDLISQRKYQFGLAISYAALILTHIPSAVLTTIFIALFTLLKITGINNYSEKIKYGTYSTLALIIGAGLSCIYLYPAITLLDYIGSDIFWNGYYEYNNWFLQPHNICPIKEECSALLLIALFQIIIPSLLLITLYIRNYLSSAKPLVHLYIMSLFCFVLMTPLSSILWSYITPLQKIQFPWRLLVMSDFLFCAFLCNTWPVITKTSLYKPLIIKIIMPISLISFLLIIASTAYFVINSPTPPIEKFVDSISKRMGPIEYIPNDKNRTASYADIQNLAAPPPLINITSGEAHVELVNRKSRNIVLDVNAAIPSTFQIRQFQFIGWHVFKEGQDISKTLALRSAKPYGQIEMDLPAGQYRLELAMPLLREEKTGMIISIISLLILAFYGFYGFGKKKSLT